VVIDPTPAARFRHCRRALESATWSPAVGQSARKGDVLAYVVPSAGASSARTRWRNCRSSANRAGREAQAARLRELADTVPRKEIEAAESEPPVSANAWPPSAGVKQRDALVAPVSGVIVSANAVQARWSMRASWCSR
jgi:hypothetical protein